jgi:hypothetical protein
VLSCAYAAVTHCMDMSHATNANQRVSLAVATSDFSELTKQSVIFVPTGKHERCNEAYLDAYLLFKKHSTISRYTLIGTCATIREAYIRDKLYELKDGMQVTLIYGNTYVPATFYHYRHIEKEIIYDGTLASIRGAAFLLGCISLYLSYFYTFVS